jgi:aspartate/methionine/tyrosine aminotransferase
MKPCSRMEGLGVSPIRAIQAGAPEGSVSLGLGEPSWSLPEPGRRALAASSSSPGPCSYGPNAGLEGLRAEIAIREGSALGETMVTAGSEGALFALIMAYAGPGDEVLAPDPGYLAYPAIARLAGSTARPYRLGEDFDLDPERFAASLSSSPRARIAVINNPSNPTGGGASLEALAEVARLCDRRDILLISDEVYRELYLGERQPSLREVTDRCVITSSVSKAWGAPGLRVGWAVGPADILEPVRLVHNYAVTAASRPSQEAALALLEASPEVLPEARLELSARWAAFAKGLSSCFGIEAKKRAGAFYYWLKIPEEARDATEVCLKARDEGRVIAVPGSAFGASGERYVRLSYGASSADISEGLRRLAPFWEARYWRKA